MNTKRLLQLAEVAKRAAGGAQVQARMVGRHGGVVGNWHDVVVDQWIDAFEYRIKPAAPRMFWIPNQCLSHMECAYSKPLPNSTPFIEALPADDLK